jgi:hypothetical protein
MSDIDPTRPTQTTPLQGGKTYIFTGRKPLQFKGGKPL